MGNCSARFARVQFPATDLHRRGGRELELTEARPL